MIGVKMSKLSSIISFKVDSNLIHSNNKVIASTIFEQIFSRTLYICKLLFVIIRIMSFHEKFTQMVTV